MRNRRLAMDRFESPMMLSAEENRALVVCHDEAEIMSAVDLPGLRPECLEKSDRQIAPSTATIAPRFQLGAMRAGGGLPMVATGKWWLFFGTLISSNAFVSDLP